MPGRLDQIWQKQFHRGPMDPVAGAALRAGRGLRDSADAGGRRQVTILSAERWAQVCARLGAALDPGLRRANLLVSGVDLERSTNCVLRVGSCRIRIVGETRPCERMDDAHPGLLAALAPPWAGGAYGEVLDDGDVATGDPVRWEADYRRPAAAERVEQSAGPAPGPNKA